MQQHTTTLNSKQKLTSKKRDIGHHHSKELWPETISEDMKRIPFQSIMLHTDNYIKSPSEHLQSLLKLFQMFKIRIWYHHTKS